MKTWDTETTIISGLLVVASAAWAATPLPGGKNAKMFWIKSSAFEDNGEIPKKYTGEGQDISPPLQWAAVHDAKSYALICDDPDAPSPQPWVHWVIFNIPSSMKSLPENVKKSGSFQGATQGQNSFDKIGYNGPMPPPKHGWHRYYFRMYALDTKINLDSGATKDQLLQEMKGHILASSQWVGRYQR